jgi:integrase
MSVRKRSWTTDRGEPRSAWVVDYTDQLGHRHLKTFARKRDADAYHGQVTVDVGAGIHTADSRSITVAGAGSLWLTSREAAGVEYTTLLGYREHLNLHITPLIGATRLAALTVPFVREFEDKLREDRSPAMVRKVLVSLSGILADAQDRGLVAQNVVRNRSPRKNGRTEARQKHHLEVGRDIPAPAEVRAIIAHLGGGRDRALLLTAVFTGLRASELRGLRWADVDLPRSELHVRQRADRFGTMGPLKSAAARRAVPLLPMVVNALREWRVACPRGGLDLVFPGRRGAPLAHITAMRGVWQPAQVAARIVERDGRAKYPGLHALRHFYASWCINRRADGGLELPIKVVQGRLGHASIQMTADRYGHLFPRGDDSAELAAAERAFLGSQSSSSTHLAPALIDATRRPI